MLQFVDFLPLFVNFVVIRHLERINQVLSITRRRSCTNSLVSGACASSLLRSGILMQRKRRFALVVLLRQTMNRVDVDDAWFIILATLLERRYLVECEVLRRLRAGVSCVHGWAGECVGLLFLLLVEVAGQAWERVRQVHLQIEVSHECFVILSW